MRASQLVSLVCLLSLGVTPYANAQTSVGVHYSALVNEYPNEAPSGAGAFISHTRGRLGVDAATTVFFPAGLGDWLWQALAGPRVGLTWGDVAIYGRARAGFVHFSQLIFRPGTVCVAVFPTPDACLADPYNLQVDLGGTAEVEISPSKILRFDLGDTLTRWSGAPADAQWTHGLQFTAGFGWKF